MNRTTICKETGCGKSVVNGDYCPVHLADNSAKRYDAQRLGSPQRKLYNTAQWKWLRKVKLGKNPMCEIAGCHHPATVVHHRIDHCGNMALFSDMKNLESLCKPHHDEETMRRNNAAGRMRQ